MESVVVDSGERWRIFAQNIPDFAFILLDAENRITDWNIGAQNLLGYTRDEAIGKSGVIIFVPEDRETGAPERELLTALAEGRAEDERWHMRADGSRFRASGTLTALRDQHSRLIGFAKVMRDVTAREREREQIERTLQERTALIREIQHRVKNNLQMIVSLISLQANRASDAGTVAALQETQSRVRAIAAVHESLYSTSNLSTISLGPYLRHLVNDLRTQYGAGSRIEVELFSADLSLDIRAALPVALICTEAVSNALRHAFPGDRRGAVRVALGYVESVEAGRAPDRAELRISDNGTGVPQDVNPGEWESTGFELIRILAAQLHATIEFRSDSRGTDLQITFPLEDA